MLVCINSKMFRHHIPSVTTLRCLLIFFLSLLVLRSMKFLLFAKDMAHSIANFSQRGRHLDGSNNQWEQILAASRAFFQGGQGLLYLFIVAPLPQISKSGSLS